MRRILGGIREHSRICDIGAKARAPRAPRGHGIGTRLGGRQILQAQPLVPVAATVPFASAHSRARALLQPRVKSTRRDAPRHFFATSVLGARMWPSSLGTSPGTNRHGADAVEQAGAPTVWRSTRRFSTNAKIFAFHTGRGALPEGSQASSLLRAQAAAEKRRRRPTPSSCRVHQL